jgi:hypothetical protein
VTPSRGLWARPGFPFVLACAAATGFVLGCRLITLRAFGYDLAYFDQWLAEGALVLIPWREGQLTLDAFFAPHNEHRVPLTRLIALALVAFDGQWNNLVQSVVNLALAGAGVAAVLVVIRRAAATVWVGLAAGLVFVLGSASPLSWENILVGFQSQFYLLVLYAVVASALCTFNPTLSWRWCLGAAVVGASTLNMASGFFIAVPLAAQQLYRMGRTRRASEVVGLLIVTAAVLAGLWGALQTARAGVVQEHRDYVVTLKGLLDCLAWPLPPSLRLAALGLWAPLVALATQMVRRPAMREDPRAWVVMVLGAWAGLQCAAMAIARAHLGQLPSSRYVDIILIGLASQVLALGLVVPRVRLQRALAAVFVVALCLGMSVRTRDALRVDLPYKRATTQTQMRSVRAFVAGDRAPLLAATFPDSPHPDVPWLAKLLENERLVALLPPSVAPFADCRARPCQRTLGLPLLTWSTMGPEALDPAVWRYLPADGLGKADDVGDLIPCSALGRWAREATRAGRAVAITSLALLALAAALTLRRTSVAPP